MSKDQTTVSWKTAVSMRDEAHRLERKKAIREVLEIIDCHMPLNGNSITNKHVRGSLKSIRKDILALKDTHK